MSTDSHNYRHDVLLVLGELSHENNEKSKLFIYMLFPGHSCLLNLQVKFCNNMTMRSKQTTK